MRAAIQDGRKGPPWFRVMLFARECGVPPWTLLPAPPAIWYLRWCYVQRAIAQAKSR